MKWLKALFRKPVVEDLDIKELAAEEFERNKEHYLRRTKELGKLSQEEIQQMLKDITEDFEIKQIKQLIEHRLVIEHLYPDRLKEEALKRVNKSLGFTD